jgi:hypothetical protein
MKSIDSTLVVKSNILTNPSSESIARRRTFTLAQLRDDYRDAQTQLVVLLTQLHDEKFTGQLSFHLLNGTVCSVETVESQKIKP